MLKKDKHEGKEKDKDKKDKSSSSKTKKDTKVIGAGLFSDLEKEEQRQKQKYESRLEALKKDKLTFCRIYVDSAKAASAVLQAAAASKKLANLEIVGPGLCEASLSHLTHLISGSPVLSYLGLFEHKLNEKDISKLTKSLGQCQLRQFVIDRPSAKLNMDSVSSDFAQNLAKNTSLTTLRILGHDLKEGTVAALSSVLFINPQLRCIDFSRNPITENGVSALSKVLDRNTTLRSLILRDVDFMSDRYLSPVTHLLHTANISHFDLSENKLYGPDSITALLLSVSSSKSLTFLELEKVNIGEAGALMLGKMISENRCGVRRLHLSGNKLTNFPCALENAALIQQLNLDDNPLSDGCIRSLLRSLRDNKSLRILSLVKCGLSDSIISEYAKDIQVYNPVLTELNFRDVSPSEKEGNPGPQEGSLLATVLLRNRNIYAERKAFMATEASSLQHSEDQSPRKGSVNSAPVHRDSIPQSLAFALGSQTLMLGGLALDDHMMLTKFIRRLSTLNPNVYQASTLLLYHDRFADFPLRAISLFNHLTCLDVSANRLRSIPIEISRLSRISRLDLRNNQIDSVPPQLADLAKLSQLFLQNNRIASLPQALLERRKLETLGLEGNPVPTVLKLIYQKWQLSSVDLSNLKLKYVPHELFAMPNVQELNLSHNLLITVPSDIELLTRLQTLDLQHNAIEQLQHLPWQLGAMTHLRALLLAGNPLFTLPDSLRADKVGEAAKNLSELQKFLLRLRDSRSPCKRMQICILGTKRSGKSTLARVLTADVLDEDVDTEEVIKKFEKEKEKKSIAATSSPDDLTITQVKSRKSEQIFDLWDYAGDQQHNVAHSYFISGRSVYLIVFNASESLDSQLKTLDYWMAAITVRAKGCPIVLVGTHTDVKLCDDAYIDYVQQQLNVRYANRFQELKRIVFCSTRTGKHVGKVMDAVHEVVDAMPCMGEQLPDSFFCLEAQLRLLIPSMKTPIISTTKFAEIAKRLGMRNRTIAQALETFHEFGSVVYVRGARAASVKRPLAMAAIGSPLEQRERALRKDSQSSSSASLSRESSLQNVSGVGGGSSSRQNNIAGSNSTSGAKTSVSSPAPKKHSLQKDYSVENLEPGAGAGGVHVEGGLIALDPMWLSHVFRSLMLHRDKEIKDGLFNGRDVENIWRPPEHPEGMAAIYLELMQTFEITFPLSTVTGAASGNEQYLVPLLLPPNPSTRYSNPMAVLKKFATDNKTDVSVRTYQLDFLPQGLFAQFLVRALPIMYPLHYWRTGAVMHEQSTNTLASIFTDEETSIHVVISGRNAGSLMLNFDNVLRSLMDHVFVVQPDVFAVCTCEKCTDLSQATRWPIGELVAAFVTTDKQQVECKASNTTFRLAQVAPDFTLLQPFTVDFANVQQGKELGTGAFATVYEAIYTPSKSTIALKRLKQPSSRPNALLSAFRDFVIEAYNWSRFKHPNVLRLLNVTIRPMCFLIELANCGNLHSYLHSDKFKSFAWPMRILIAQQIATGLNYLHTLSPPVIHRDIKSYNVLLSQEKSSLVAKLADFGVCWVGNSAAGRVVDNPVWLAPEIMEGKAYTTQADIYSFGIVLWEISSGAEPFGEYTFSFASELEDQILAGLRPSLHDDCPESFSILISRCWNADPIPRPNAAEIINTLETLKSEVK